MSLILLTSISGAPGVSTTALGLTLAWPDSSLLVETDSHQAVLAGHLRAQEPPEPNLSTVATAAQRSGDLRSLMWERIVRPLPEDTEANRRMYLPGPPTPWARAAVEARWSTIAPALDHLGDAGIDTVVDLGRLMPPTTPTPLLIAEPLLTTAAMVLVMLEPTLPSIAAARVMCEGLRDQSSRVGLGERLALVIRRPAPAGRPRRAAGGPAFSDKEIEKTLGLPVKGSVAHDPMGASWLSAGITAPRSYSKTMLARSMVSLAKNLHGQAHYLREDIDHE